MNLKVRLWFMDFELLLWTGDDSGLPLIIFQTLIKPFLEWSHKSLVKTQRPNSPLPFLDFNGTRTWSRACQSDRQFEGSTDAKYYRIFAQERGEQYLRALYACLSKVVVFCGNFICTSKGYVERESYLTLLEREGGTLCSPRKRGGFLWQFWMHQ